MRLAADGEPPIVSVNEYCDGSVSIDLDYLDGHPDFLGEYSSIEEAEKHHVIQFVYPVTLHVGVEFLDFNIVGHQPPHVSKPPCPTCKRPYRRH